MPARGRPLGLTGVAVLVVEDEMLLALDYRTILEEKGCDVLGPVPTERKALAVLEERRPDVVVLDLNLNGEQPTSLAKAMLDLGIPFAIVTGYEKRHDQGSVFASAPRLEKPVHAEQLCRVLAELVGS
jgi:two-component SAPR family response regulator